MSSVDERQVGETEALARTIAEYAVLNGGPAAGFTLKDCRALAGYILRSRAVLRADAVRSIVRASGEATAGGWRTEVESAIRELMADECAFDVAVGRLCRLVGWRYPAADAATTPAEVGETVAGPDRTFGYLPSAPTDDMEG